MSLLVSITRALVHVVAAFVLLDPDVRVKANHVAYFLCSGYTSSMSRP